MNTEADYERKIARYNHARLRRLWNLIDEGRTAGDGWEAGKAFEYLVLRAFQIEGAEVRWPYEVEIDDNVVEQIDGAIYTDGLACLIECKDRTTKADIEPVAKIRNQILRRPEGTIGIIFSRYGFTASALTLARFTLPQAILLWTGEEIAFALERRYMRKMLLAKYRRCIEEGAPDYRLNMEELP
jgi:hypothetical protein